jgi:hypothetical protein
VIHHGINEITNAYDANGKLISHTVINSNRNGITDGVRSLLTYNALGQNIHFESANYDTSYLFWRNNMAIDYYKNAGGFDTLTVYYAGDSLSWTNNQMIKNVYDISGNLLMNETDNWFNNAWLLSYRELYQYNSSGYLIADTSFHIVNQLLSYASLSTFIVSTTGKNLIGLYQIYNGSWENATENLYNYDAVDSLILNYELSWNGASWDSSLKIMINYYSYFPLSYSRNESQFVNGLWESILSTLSSYDSLNRPISLTSSGISGQSASNCHYDYFPDGSYQTEYINTCSQGGIGNYSDCTGYLPLNISSASEQFILCNNSSINTDFNVTGGSGQYIYSWTPFDQISDSTLLNPEFSPDTSTIYYLRITDQIGSVIDASININVAAPVNFPIGADTNICLPVNLLLNAPQYMTSYLWTDGSNGSIASVSIYSPDTVIYWVKVTDNNNCLSYDSILVYADICSGISALLSKDFSITPNPVHTGNVISINNNVEKAFVLKIYDLNGRAVFEKKVFSSESSIEWNLTAGSYFYEVTGKDDYKYFGKIVSY